MIIVESKYLKQCRADKSNESAADKASQARTMAVYELVDVFPYVIPETWHIIHLSCLHTR